MGPEAIVVVASLILTIIMVLVILFVKPSKTGNKGVGVHEEPGRIVVVKRCGDRTVQEDYREGDYVGKQVGDCVIIGIYRISTESTQGRT